ncbi:Alpha crystallin-containing small heat shock protein variant NtermFhHSP35a [Fasciola gigantica]|uniref:Alpha crystallin-containing small heat shock protein variant NtermFhHSP35a n=1 Tax=Fasciola gigantica TaxID=46835 RepID=A0A504YSZ8_FASGI|nr:Alpha crystallin-containing small heat shock protein variant NtermFhHSP35a [Fasciola gigantica]TPP60899.1 Alpha crystallin-containing small heat shock protein variant NtermFhHSP35a [Fasciola gigantica]
MIRPLGSLYTYIHSYGSLARSSFTLVNLQRLCTSHRLTMTNTQGKEIPVKKDDRTFEQRRHDLVKNLEKHCGKETGSEKCTQQQNQNHQHQHQPQPQAHHTQHPQQPQKSQNQKQHSTQIAENHQNQLSTGEWFHELNQWLNEMNKMWSHEWNQAWRNMFSLVPKDKSDMEPSSKFGVFGSTGYVPSILSHMEHQIQVLRQNMEQLIPNYHPELMEKVGRGYSDEMIPLGGLGNTQLDYLKDAYEPGDDGHLRFKLRFDLRGYSPEDVHVEADKNRLTVHAKRTDEKDGTSRMCEYCRTVYLPDKVDDEKCTAHLSKDGILTVEAPVKQAEVAPIKYGRDHQMGIQPKPSTENSTIKPIGKMGLTILEDGRIHLEVPVDAGFKSEDLQVGVANNCVVVSGKHEVEEDIGAKEKTWHVNEFRRSYPVPHSVDPLSLTAELIDHTVIVEGPTVTKSP